MEHEDIVKGNSLIAEWLGFTYFPHNMEGVTDPGWKTTIDTHQISKFNLTVDLFKPKEERSEVKRIYLGRSHNDLLYHKSYDWLMPVYKQIMEISDEDISDYRTQMIFALGTGKDIIEVWTHLVKCVEILTLNNKRPPLEVPKWKNSYHLESEDSHWIILNHNEKITLSYLPNKKYSRYNVTTTVNYETFQELVNFIKKIS